MELRSKSDPEVNMRGGNVYDDRMDLLPDEVLIFGERRRKICEILARYGGIRAINMFVFGDEEEYKYTGCYGETEEDDLDLDSFPGINKDQQEEYHRLLSASEAQAESHIKFFNNTCAKCGVDCYEDFYDRDLCADCLEKLFGCKIDNCVLCCDVNYLNKENKCIICASL